MIFPIHTRILFLFYPYHVPIVHLLRAHSTRSLTQLLFYPNARYDLLYCTTPTLPLLYSYSACHCSALLIRALLLLYTYATPNCTPALSSTHSKLTLPQVVSHCDSILPRRSSYSIPSLFILCTNCVPVLFLIQSRYHI